MKPYLLLCFCLLLFGKDMIGSPLAGSDTNPQKNSLCFIKNEGQIIDQHNNPRNDIDFKVSGDGIQVFIGKGQIHYQWAKVTEPQLPHFFRDKLKNRTSSDDFQAPAGENTPIETYRLDVVLKGANVDAELITGSQLAFSEHYYLPHYSGTVSSYAKIIYKDVYPNIDWVLYADEHGLKYDFVVRPGGNISDIQLEYQGATSLKLKEGVVVATTPMGSITEHKPYCYESDTRSEISSAFVLNENTLSFNLGSTGFDKTIVIDPVLDWGTYYGSSSTDIGFDVATNNAGDAFMCGWTQNAANIATVGAFKTTITGSNDAFIVKFNTSGSRQWATYYGGTGQDWFYSIEYDHSSDHIYISGETSSAGVATTGVHQPTISSGFDGLLSKFDVNGGLVWSTYHGGNGTEDCNIAVDANGSIYLFGETSSTTGIATTGSHQATKSGGWDAYVAKFSGAGTKVWGTYFGATGDESFLTAACDGSGPVYLGGLVTSAGIIATTNAHQTSFGAGPCDGLLAKFNNAGTLQWCTYYGGSADEVVGALACDPSGDVYVAGYTASSNGMTTTGSHQAVKGAAYDAYIAKFNSSGVRQWGTYYGGAGDDFGFGIKTSPAGRAYMMSRSTSSANMTTPNAHQTTLTGSDDFVLAEFTGSGTLAWATYYGGTGSDLTLWAPGQTGGHYWFGGGYIDLSTSGKLYITGATTSGSGITTAGAFQQYKSGTTTTSFLSSWYYDTTVTIHRPFTDTVLCQGETFNLHYDVSFSFLPGNVFTVEMSDMNGSFGNPQTLATINGTVTGVVPVTIPATTAVGSGYILRITANNPVRQSSLINLPIRVKPLPQVSASSNSPVCEAASLNLAATSSTTGTVAYNWTGPASYSTVNNQNPGRNPATLAMAGDYIVTAILDGCESYDTTEVIINATPAKPGAGSNSPVCPNTPMLLNSNSGTPGVIYTWTGPNGFNSTVQHPTVSTNATHAMAGSYSVTASRNGCVSLATVVNVVVDTTTPTPTASANTPVCAGTDLNLTALNIPGATYAWTGPNGFTSTQQNPSIALAQPRHQGKYTVVATLNNCVSRPSEIDVEVNVMTTIGAYISPSDTICKGYTATFVGFPQNMGPSAQLQWYKNYQPVPGATGKVYATNQLVTGDEIFCYMVVTGICNVPIVATSDTFQMVVLPIRTVPSVTIKADPGLAVSPDQGVRFTADVIHGGTTPKYQWYKNGVILPGAVQATLNLGGLYFGDKVSVNIISEDPCADEKNASDTVTIGHPTGIDETSNNKVQVYPNPNKGSFTISGISGREVHIAISNIVGQSVYQATATNVTGNLQLNTNLSKGVYLIRISSDNQKQTVLKFTVAD